MHQSTSNHADEPIELRSAAGAPADFTVRIDGADGPARRLRITGADPATGTAAAREYRLDDALHPTYLDWHAQLARDFGTRLPSARMPAPAPTFQAPYQALLTENLTPDMRYGYGDPAVTRAPSGETPQTDAPYYLLVTSNDAPHTFPIARSTDLRTWQPAGFVFPPGAKPRWAADGENVGDFWAPELHRVGGRWRVYFVARERDSLDLCIGVATAPGPEGPFTALDAPLLRGGVIDPHVLVDASGSAYLFWKEDTNDVWPGLLSRLLHERPELIAALFPDSQDRRTAALVQTLWPWLQRLGPMERFFVQQPLIEAVTADFAAFEQRLGQLARTHAASDVRSAAAAVLGAVKTPIFAQPLAADGLSLAGERTAVLQNDRQWEAHLIEGIWVREQAGRYYLFYAGNDFSTAQYGIGVAVADAPLGPYRKADEPLLRSSAEWLGPGHPSVADAPDGTPRLFLHAFFPGRTGYKVFRALLSLPIGFQGDRVVIG